MAHLFFLAIWGRRRRGEERAWAQNAMRKACSLSLVSFGAHGKRRRRRGPRLYLGDSLGAMNNLPFFITDSFLRILLHLLLFHSTFYIFTTHHKNWC